MKKYIFILLMFLVSSSIIIYTNNEYKEFIEQNKNKYQKYSEMCLNPDSNISCEKVDAKLKIYKQNKYPGNNYDTYFSYLKESNFIVIMICIGLLLVIFPLVYTEGKYVKFYPFYLLIPLMFLIIYFISTNYASQDSKSFVTFIPYLISLCLMGYSYFNIGLIIKKSEILFYKLLTIYGIYVSALFISDVLEGLFKKSLQINSVYAVNDYNNLVNYMNYLPGSILFGFMTTIMVVVYYKFNKIKKF